jgi:hypothetical protein
MKEKWLKWYPIIIVVVPLTVTSILLAGSVITNNKKIPNLEIRVSDLEFVVKMQQEENGFLIRELIRKILPCDQANQIIALADQHKESLKKALEERRAKEINQ